MKNSTDSQLKNSLLVSPLLRASTLLRQWTNGWMMFRRANQTAFQINRNPERSTGDQLSETRGQTLSTKPLTNSDRHSTWMEVVAIAALFAACAGQLPPDVNESHYLTKAKHFWDPQWCPNDLFLSSSFAHWFFYVTCGWVTKFVSLGTFALLGRLVTWTLLAFAWQRLSRTLIPIRAFSVLSAMFFLLLNERFHLAGEWVVGGFEAKGFAYAAVILALSFVIKKQWQFAWPMLGVAALFHVLVGGWALLSTAFAFGYLAFKQQSASKPFLTTISKHTRLQWLPIAVTIGLVLAAAIPPLLSDISAPAGTAALARSIYVHQRISHHLTFSAFPALHVARFACLLLFGYFVHRWVGENSGSIARRIKPLEYFCLGSLMISFVGLLLSGLAEQQPAINGWANGLLRFYWFRIADFAVPTTVSLTSCMVLAQWLLFGPRKAHRTIALFVVGTVTAATGLMIVERHADPRPRADQSTLPDYEDDYQRTIQTWENWKRVCEWIRQNTPRDAVFITPAQQQTFKWYAHRTEVACWKDIPQDAASIIEWRERASVLIDPQNAFANGLLQYTDEQLIDLGKRYGATHLLLPQYQVDMTTEGTTLRQVYPENPDDKLTFAVFELSQETQ